MVEEEPNVQAELADEDDDVQVDFLKLGKKKGKGKKKDGKKGKKIRQVAEEETSKC